MIARGWILLATLAISACATARLHTPEQLNDVALSCGLALGELVQEEEAKPLLFVFRVAPRPEQRACVYRWAKRNHLRLVIIEAVNEPVS